MADKSFGVKELNLLNASGTPTITSPNNLNLNANNVAISTNVTIGGNLTVSGNIGISSLNVTGISTFTDIQVAEKIIHVGDADTDISFGTDSINFKVGGNTKFNASANGLTAYDKLIPDADNSHLLGQGSGPQRRWSQVHAVTFHGDGSNLTGISAGISTSPSNVQATWKLGGGSGSGFTFTGPGQDGSEGNPDIYLVRGQRYLFDNTTLAGNHPFEFRNAANNADYTDGVSGAQNGLQYINVQHDAPAQLKYRCTIHQNSMLGNIYIVGQHLANGADNRVLTATSAYGMNAESNVLYDGTNFGINKSPSRTLDVGGIIRSSHSVCFGDNSSTPSEGAAIHRPAASTLAFVTNNTEKLRIGDSGQIGIGGANYGTSGQVLTSQGSGSAVQWASPVVAGSILQTVYGTTTNEIVVTSTSFQNFTALNTSITRMSSNSHLWVWINAVRLLVQADSNEARVRITDGTSATTPYRLVNYDSDGNYLSFNPCLNWYWTKSHTAGTTVTITPQIRTINGNNVVWGDNGDTSMMIIQEIAR